jgi:hypothetical protein
MAIANKRRLALIITALGMGGPTAAFAQAANPFAQLAGSWRGSGVVRLLDGGSEHLSCRGTYEQKAGGSQLSLSIRCQSENNKIDMRSSLSYENGGVAGHWEERNFGLEGEVNGSAAASNLRLQISGQLQGAMAVFVSGASHRVSVTTAGPGFKSVSITFSRG